MSTIAIADYSIGTTYGQVAAPRRSAAAPATSVRLTRRGRFVIVLAALAAIAVGVIAFGSSTAATGDVASLEVATLTVQPGQTLWQIAAAANPTGDVRDTVDDIIRLNALTSASDLQIGTSLAVPVYE